MFARAQNLRPLVAGLAALALAAAVSFAALAPASAAPNEWNDTNPSGGIDGQYMVTGDCFPRGVISMRIPSSGGLDTTDAVFEQYINWSWTDPDAPPQPQEPLYENYADELDFFIAYDTYLLASSEWQSQYSKSGSVSSGVLAWPAGQSSASSSLTVPAEVLALGEAVAIEASMNVTFYEPGSDPLNPVNSPRLWKVLTAEDFAWLTESNGICSGTGLATPGGTVSIVKSSNATQVEPGGSVAYSIVASNTGDVPAGGSVVVDPIPAGLTEYSWTCAATGGAVCANPSGTGSLEESVLTFPPGGVVTYNVTATAALTVPAWVTNVATLEPPQGWDCEDCISTVSLPSPAVLAITKTADTAVATPGGEIVYTVTVANSGGDVASGAVVSDPLAAGIGGYVWTCSASGGAVCPAAAGAGALEETISVFPGESSVTYTITATVIDAPPAQIANVASVVPPVNVSCGESCSAQVIATRATVVPPVPPVDPVPSVDPPITPKPAEPTSEPTPSSVPTASSAALAATGLSPLVAVPLGVLLIFVGSTLWLIYRWRRTTRLDQPPVVDRQAIPSQPEQERSNIS